ncbi:MAG: hypothetical protein IJS41_09685 [Clostridia bacterium]|nr:hypothetical protein [Clostridia bacterium]
MKKVSAILLAVLLCAVGALGAFAEGGAAQGGYVLMNIPYEAFYAAEVADASTIDAVTSSTLMKPRTIGLAGGSYHVDPAGSDITGVIFPVYVEDLNMLSSLGGAEITDESAVEITVTNKGKESTTAFTGSEALFEAPSFSWYALSDTPAAYKTLNADGTFGAVQAEPTVLDGTASIIYDRHADVVIKIAGVDDALADKNVSGAVLVLDDGTKVGLRHIANLWRKTEIGFALDSDICAAVMGKTIASIEYITLNGVYTVQINLAIPDDLRLLQLTGTYIELFPEFAKEDYKDYWMECIKAYVDDDAAAEMYYTMLTATYMGTLKGQEAIDAYAADPASLLFDCFFENGVAKFIISGDVISGVDAEGNELFRHTYHFTEDLPVSFFGQPIGADLHVYQTDDADAGAFTYFAFADDTLKETYHIEFRYGEHLQDLANYSEGEYAYWLASGINDGYKDNQIKACIKLFVDENVGGQEEQPEAETTASPNGVFPAIAGENGTTYVSLFDTIVTDEWNPLWVDYIGAVVGEDVAPTMAAALQGSVTSNLHGEEAIAAFKDGGYAFDCHFINGAQSLTFKDNTVTVLKTDGSQETHTYEYLGQYNIGEGETMMYQGAEIPMAFPVDVYKSTDEAGEFNYFMMREDTMDTTWHLEFRYGSDLEALQGYMVGPYAYWLAAGIDEKADADTINNVIALFCLENMDYSAHSETALKQIADLGFVGAWQADLSAFGEEYAAIDLSMTIDEAGHGITMMNGLQTADFEAYAVDNGEKGDGVGIYVAYSNLEYEAEAAPYTITVNDAGQTVLTLTADDGTINWEKQ